MAQKRLTDVIEKFNGIDGSHEDYTVDVTDDTQHPDGSGFRTRLDNKLKNISWIAVLGCLIHRPIAGAEESVTDIRAGDWVFHIDETPGDERLLIGLALDTITNVPTELDDGTKFQKFLENNPLLP